jgi:hypothetical protein
MASLLCGKCFLECEGEKTIACGNCDKWFHQKCESLSNIHFSVLGKSSFSYFCSDCCLDINGNFDFSAGLQRLRLNRNFVDTVKLENIFMRFLPSKLLLPQHFDSLLAEDKVATSFLGSNSDYWAVETNENGNFFFNSLSIGILKI